MEEKLKRLFDFQRFERNPRLEQLMSETRQRYGTELTDDELGLVYAAGETPVQMPGENPNEQRKK